MKVYRFIAVPLLAAAAAHAGDWPQFRGPTGQGPRAGRSGSAHLERDGERRLEDGGSRTWLVVACGRRRPGLGHHRGHRSRRRTTSLRLLAYDVVTGNAAVDAEVFSVSDTTLLNQKNSFASPTPVIDPEGERIYVHFGAQGTAAVAARGETAGEVLWRTRFPYTSQHGNGGRPSCTASCSS